LVVISQELEEMFQCMFDGKVPPLWLKAYPSLKPLGSWARELILRVEQLQQWAERSVAACVSVCRGDGV
jgi:dynein heavy chain